MASGTLGGMGRDRGVGNGTGCPLQAAGAAGVWRATCHVQRGVLVGSVEASVARSDAKNDLGDKK